MKKSFVAATGSLVLLLGACSTQAPSASKFETETEKFLKSSEVVKENFGQAFGDASCTRPTSNAVGTKYTCTGTGTNDGVAYSFDAEITSKSGYTVIAAQAPTTLGASDTTPAAAGTAPVRPAQPVPQRPKVVSVYCDSSGFRVNVLDDGSEQHTGILC